MGGRDLFEQLEARREQRAAKLVGRDDAARLRWLIEFGEDADRLTRLSAAKFDRVAAAIDAFAERAGALARNVGEALTVETAAELASIVRTGLRAYATGTTPDFPPLDFAHLQFSLVPGSDRSPWIGPWRSLFLIALGEVVRAEHHRLRTCAASACGRLFFKRKRGLYCSPACSLRERERRFRENLERYRRRRHQYYVARLARLKGVSPQTMRKMVKRHASRKPQANG